MDLAACALAVTPLRADPDDASEQHSQVLLGERLRVLARRGDWAEVVVPDGYRGFVRAAALGPPPVVEPAHVVVVPEASGRFLGSWLAEPAEGTEPLVAARARATGAAVVETARLFLDTPYESGGVTRRGIDCSGLVQAVHRRFGLLLRRDADMQQGEGREVDPEDVRAGDLYCFGDHVAIAVGDGTIVHATGARGRTVEEPMPADLARRILAIRRIYGPMLAAEKEDRCASAKTSLSR